MRKGQLIKPSDLRGREYTLVGCKVNAEGGAEHHFSITGFPVFSAYYEHNKPLLELFLGKRGGIRAIATTDDQWHILPRGVTVPHLQVA